LPGSRRSSGIGNRIASGPLETASRSLTDEEVYAVTAYILHLNGIIGEGDVINAQTLPTVKMPNRDNFIMIYPREP
jgi:hypothetical protein